MKVLFVCSGNAYRSPSAEAMLKKLRPDLEVDSAGTYVAVPIAEEAREFLAKDSAQDYLKKVPEELDSKNLKKYNLIIAMEQRHKDAVLNRCPECEGKIVVWNIRDPFFLPHEHTAKIFNQIKEKTVQLSNSI
jgi:protein-tyrosine phosphatase